MRYICLQNNSIQVIIYIIFYDDGVYGGFPQDSMDFTEEIKMFKKLYAIILSLLAVVLFVFSVTDITNKNGAPKYLTQEVEEDALYYANRLSLDFHPVFSARDNSMATEIYNYFSSSCGFSALDSSENQAVSNKTYTVQKQTYTLLNSEYIEIYKALGYEDKDIPVISEPTLNNVIVRIKGSDSSTGAVLITAHYDSEESSLGLYDNAIAAASMMEFAKHLKTDKITYKNDLIFLFSDANQFHQMGAKKFAASYQGYENIKYVLNFQSIGTEGNLTVLESGAGYSSLAKLASVNTSIISNSFISRLFSHSDTKTDYSVYEESGKPGVTIGSSGQQQYNGTYYDGYDNAEIKKTSAVRQTSKVLAKTADKLGNADLNKINSTEGVYINYLSLFVFVYPTAVSVVLLVLLVALIALFVYFNNKNKNTEDKSLVSLTGVAKGALIQVSAAVIAGAVIFIIQKFFGIINSGFGDKLNSPYYSSILLNLGVMILSAGIALVAYIYLAKALKVKARNIVYGNIALNALIAVITGIFAMEYSPLFMITSLLMVGAMLAAVLLEKKYSARFGESIRKLALPAGVSVLVLPLYVTTMFMAVETGGSVMLPLLAVMSVLYFGFSVPYLAQLKQAVVYYMPKFRNIYTSIPVIVLAAVLIIVEWAAPLSKILNTKLYDEQYSYSKKYEQDGIYYVYNTPEDKEYWAISDKQFFAALNKYSGTSYSAAQECLSGFSWSDEYNAYVRMISEEGNDAYKISTVLNSKNTVFEKITKTVQNEGVSTTVITGYKLKIISNYERSDIDIKIGNALAGGGNIFSSVKVSTVNGDGTNDKNSSYEKNVSGLEYFSVKLFDKINIKDTSTEFEIILTLEDGLTLTEDTRPEIIYTESTRDVSHVTGAKILSALSLIEGNGLNNINYGIKYVKNLSVPLS